MLNRYSPWYLIENQTKSVKSMQTRLAMNNVSRLRKITYLLFFLLTTTASFFPAYAWDGQILKGVTVTATIKDGTLETAIREIHKITKVAFAYDKQLLSSYRIAGCV